jgi:hypothetical protein
VRAQGGRVFPGRWSEFKVVDGWAVNTIQPVGDASGHDGVAGLPSLFQIFS